jgi:hypothetical protein
MANRPSLDELYSGAIQQRPSLDDIYAGAAPPPAPVAQESQNPGFFDRVSQDLANRQANTAISAQQYNAGNQGVGESLFQGMGQGALFANDAVGEALKSAGSGLNYVTGGYAGKAATNVLNTLADTRVGRDMVGAKNELASFYRQIEQNSPRTARNLDALGGLGALALSAPSVAPMAGAAMGAGVAGTKAVAKAGVKAADAVAAPIARAVVPTVSEDIGEIAQRARELNVPLSLDQIAPTRVRNTVQKVSQEMPLSGVDDFQKTQQAAFNKALANSIGQQSDTLGPRTIKTFLQDSNNKFSSAIGTGNFSVDPADLQTLSTLENGLSGKVTAPIGDIVKTNIKQFRDDLAQAHTGSVIPAQKLASLRSDLVQKLPSIDSQARPHVAELVDIIDDIAARNAPPGAVATLKQARREWRNFKTLEPLLEKSTTGSINPPDLMNRVAASPYIKASRSATGDDDLVDLARIGKLMAKKGGSDTAQKAAFMGTGAAVTAAALNPLLAVKMGAGLAGNRALQSFYNQSPRMLKAAVKKSDPLQRFYKP